VDATHSLDSNAFHAGETTNAVVPIHAPRFSKIISLYRSIVGAQFILSGRNPGSFAERGSASGMAESTEALEARGELADLQR
jgi:hypothetical protein